MRTAADAAGVLRMLLAISLLGCAQSSVGPTTTAITHLDVNIQTVVNTVPVTTTTTVVVQAPPTPCDLRTPGVICTYAGIPHIAQFSPEGLPRTQSALYLPIDVTWNAWNGQLYILDCNNHRIRTVLPDGAVVTVMGSGFLGDGIYNLDTELWEGGAALDYALNHPSGIAFDPFDRDVMYVAAWHNSRVVSDVGNVALHYAGTGGRTYGDGDPDGDGVFLASDAIFNLVASVTFDEDGALYLNDQANMIIRKILPADGTISTVAGTPPVGVVAQYGYAGDGGVATEARFSNNLGGFVDPQGRVVYHEGALYIADTENQVIRRVDLATNIITTVAGSYVSTGINGLDTNGDGLPDIVYGDPGYGGDGGTATAARLNRPHDVAFDPDGTMYIADYGNHCVRSVNSDGVIETFAGQCDPIRSSDPTLPMGDGGDPLDATLNHPSGLDVDADGNVFIADQDDHVIRVVWK